MGPSMTHRFDSYLVRMKFSILASDGTWPGASFASQYLFARALPHLSTLWSCSSVHVSRSTDLTLEMCVPMPRWIPEQRMHMKTPRFQLAHRGSGGESVGVQRMLLCARRLRTLVPLAVRARLVTLELDEVLERRPVLLSAISGGIGPPRHVVGSVVVLSVRVDV